jgi:hypothetical protein
VRVIVKNGTKAARLHVHALGVDWFALGLPIIIAK